MMWVFENSYYSLLLLILPVLIFYFRSFNREQQHTYASMGMSRSADMKIGILQNIMHFKQIGYAVVFVCMVLALSNPQTRSGMNEALVDSLDIVIAMDVSASMKAEDIKPNRMGKAKRFAAELIAGLSPYRIAVASYAGTAGYELPFTADYKMAEAVVQRLDPDFTVTQGTDFNALFRLLNEDIINTDRAAGVLVLISDGEHHEEDIMPWVRKMAAGAWKIYTIVMGTKEGGFIPLQDTRSGAFKRAETGELIRSVPDFQLMENIAKEASGRSFDLAADPHAAKQIISDIKNMKSGEKIAVQYMAYRSWYPIFSGLALLALISILLIPQLLKYRSRFLDDE
jgi:Ca-activated chloride channel homolog